MAMVYQIEVREPKPFTYHAMQKGMAIAQAQGQAKGGHKVLVWECEGVVVRGQGLVINKRLIWDSEDFK